MKKILALILTAVLSVSLCAPAGAAHVTATEAISTLETLGLVKGTGSGFEPERTATRAEAVTMLVRLLGREDAALRATGWCPFSDAGWAAKYITYAYNSGLVTGQSAGWFGSAADVQIRDYLTMLLRALGYSTATGDFTWAGSIAFADRIGLTHGEYTAQTPMLREDLALISYTALTMKMKNSERTLIEQLYLDGAVDAYRSEPLGSLIRAGKVGIVVALLVEGGYSVDVAVQHHAGGHTQVHNMAVDDGKHTRHTAAGRTNVVVLLTAEFSGAGTENF